MKISLLILFILSSCAWRQKDFSEDLEHTGAKPQVEADKDLLEKFEVQPVAKPVVVPDKEPAKPEVASAKKKALEKKRPPAKVKPPAHSKASSKSAAPESAILVAPKKNQLPADYPAELLAVNARAEKVWQQYRPNHTVGEKILLDIHYMGMTVGRIQVSNLGKKIVNDSEAWHFHARFKSAPFYSKIYELDDTVDTFVSSNEFLGLRYSLIQRESKQNVDDLQLHDREQFKTFWFYKQKKSDGSVKDKQQEAYIPHFSIDPFSVLFLFQGLPLKNGDVYEIPIINKSKILILKSVVEAREKVETELGPRHAVRIRATTQYTGDHLKDGDLTFWFTDDVERKLIKAKAKIKIGSVTADIVKK